MRLYIIAGEASGDQLGAQLLQALKLERKNEPLCLSGIGGPLMTREGLKSLFPMETLSVMGFLEVLPHIFTIFRCISNTVNDIITTQPDIVLTIDSPGFCFRVVKKLRKRGFKGICVHYVAPSVWAYNPSRATKIALLYDHLFALLPFEPSYFPKIDCQFVGHPIVEKGKIQEEEGVAWRLRHNIAEKTCILCLLPGSRTQEINKLIPIYEKTIYEVKEKIQDLAIVVIIPERFRNKMQEIASMWKIQIVIVSEEKEKYAAYRAATMALAKSGTCTLELAAFAVPMVVTYKVHWLTAFLLRRFLHVNYVSLVNILLKKPVLPEFLQEKCDPTLLAEALLSLYFSPLAQDEQKKNMHEALQALGRGASFVPSERAAHLLLRYAKKDVTLSAAEKVQDSA